MQLRALCFRLLPLSYKRRVNADSRGQVLSGFSRAAMHKGPIPCGIGPLIQWQLMHQLPSASTDYLASFCQVSTTESGLSESEVMPFSTSHLAKSG